MAQPFKVQYDDFGGGLNLRLAAHLIQKNEAVVAKNVDLQDRYIKGLKDLGSSVDTIAYASSKWLWYSPAGDWISGSYANETRFAMNDGPRVYSTRESQRPLVTTPSQSYSLGISPIEGLSYSGTTGSQYQVGTYKYAFTFVTADGLESNPQDFDLTLVLNTAQYLDFSAIPTSDDPRVVARRVYRSLANNDAMYFLYEIPDNSTTTFKDDYPDSRLDLTRPLTWNDGGFPDSGGIYVEDHSVPPTLTVLSTGLHSANGATGRSGSGIVFGAVGSTVYWSALGFPDYWPVVNQFSLAENVESIVALGGATFVFTPNFIYQARGDSDSQITWNRTNAAFGVKRGMGRFTTPTAQGVLFFAQDGLAVFDGSSARLVAENKLPRNYFDSLTISAVGFFRNRFHVFTTTSGDSATIIFDFRDGILNPVITTSTHLVTAAHVANYAEPVTADVLPALPAIIGSIRVSNPGSYKVISGGSGVSTTLTVGSGAPTGGTQATAVPLFSYDRVVVLSGGSGYDTAPTVTFAAPAGQGRAAKGVATIAGGKVISITVTDPGEGYTSDEIKNTATISLAGGTPSSTATFDVFAKFSSVTLSNAGAGYITIPPVTVNFSGTVAVNAQLFAELMPQLYNDSALLYVNNSLYRMGGDSINSINPTSTVVDTIDQYDFSTDGWTRLSATLSAGGGPGSALRGMASFSNGSVAYIAGGTSGSLTTATSAEVRSWNGSSFSSITDLPYARSYGALVRLLGGNMYYFCGVSHISGNMSNEVYRWDGTTWNTHNLTVGPTPYFLAYHSAVLVGTKIYIFGGKVSTSNTISGASLNSSVFIWDTSDNSVTMDTTGPTYGWTGRTFVQVAAYDSKIYLFGGLASLNNTELGSTLSDLWVYDPSATPAWSCRTGEVINAYARARAGYASDPTNGILYTVGGLTTYARYTADGVKIPLAQASDCSGTPGMYVVENASTAVKLFEGGSRMNNWVWQGRREVGPIPGPRMTWVRSRAMAVDSVKFGVTFQNGNGGESTWPTYATTTAGATGLGSQVRFWYPAISTGGAPVPTGQWLSLKLQANSSTSAEVYRVEIDAKMDTDGR